MASIGGAAPTKSACEPNREKLPTSREIQSRAYQLYMERGGADGSAFRGLASGRTRITTKRQPQAKKASTKAK
jgi:hypothetical protein